jgi:hypothetical protein
MAREAARRHTCAGNLRQFGLALHNFHGAFERFPPSSRIQQIDGNRTETWSWQVLLLPYGDEQPLYDNLSIDGGQPLFGGGEAPAAVASNSILPGHVCPSSAVFPFSDDANGWGALTSYKGIGATHHESLAAAFPGQSRPPLYNPAGRHPDGVLFPADRGLRLAEIRDGSSNTLIATETLEPSYAVWTFGEQSALVGLPTQGFGAVAFASQGGRFVPVECAAAGSDPEAAEMMTYLDFPYTNRDRYSQNAVYGPSSRHASVVNHLLADGSVRGIGKSIDPAVYMFLITRLGQDPVSSDY